MTSLVKVYSIARIVYQINEPLENELRHFHTKRHDIMS